MTRLFRLSLAIPFLVLASFLLGSTASQAQTAPPGVNSLLPGPKPTDAPAEWKRHVGIYKYSSYQAPDVTGIILERNQRLYLRSLSGSEIEIRLKDGKLIVPEPDGRRAWVYGLSDPGDGSPPAFTYLTEAYIRTDAGTDPAHFYHITPRRPVSTLRERALKLAPPAERGPYRKPELVEVATLDPAIHLDIRYASANNFLSTPVYTEARAFMQRPAAEALVRVLHKLQPQGYGLQIHDAYRPWYVTKIFWDATPPEGKIFVADPQKGSKHNRGCAVDLTLYEIGTGKIVEMPGLYDEMSPRSFPSFPGGTSLQRWHRDLLRRAMESEGFAVNEDEWWHFDYKDWKQYGILNVAFEKIADSHKP
ncbi:MAG TPA: M15 family metallopeptidase [Candidatus Limnocylindrales bacterium]|nr:M15 family metallopeptidase [Candidatus Limnocylindrales bacterium]